MQLMVSSNPPIFFCGSIISDWASRSSLNIFLPREKAPVLSYFTFLSFSHATSCLSIKLVLFFPSVFTFAEYPVFFVFFYFCNYNIASFKGCNNHNNSNWKKRIIYKGSNIFFFLCVQEQQWERFVLSRSSENLFLEVILISEIHFLEPVVKAVFCSKECIIHICSEAGKEPFLLNTLTFLHFNSPRFFFSKIILSF